MSQRKAALPSKLFPELFLLSGGSAHPGQPPDSAPDRHPGCCVPASHVPDHSKCSSSCPHCYLLSSGLMAWGQCCQPRLPPPAWTPLVSPLPPSVAHTIDSVDVCHTAHTSVLNPGWEVQLSPSPNPSMVPWGASSGPRSPSSFPSTLDGCAGPGLCAEYIWDPTLQIVQLLPLDRWLLLS